VYLLQFIAHLLGSSVIDLYFGLVPIRVTQDLMLWQLVTYMFLHGGFFHILFNMLTLFMFGNELERYWGTPRFLNYYFITGIGAGICSWIVAPHSNSGRNRGFWRYLRPSPCIRPDIPEPHRVYQFSLPVKVKWLVLIMGAVAFMSSVSGADSGIASIAHLGGMVIGYLFLKEKIGSTSTATSMNRAARSAEEAV